MAPSPYNLIYPNLSRHLHQPYSPTSAFSKKIVLKNYVEKTEVNLNIKHKMFQIRRNKILFNIQETLFSIFRLKIVDPSRNFQFGGGII